MVLGAFSGSEATQMDVCDYVNKWLDVRLRSMPDNRFNSFMINAIEERYDEKKCEKLIRLLEKRKRDGDFDVIGFSCHQHELARKIADTFPEFELIMMAYNYSNRWVETFFKDYVGDASFIAMKPLIWAEYGIPFCCVNDLPDPKALLGIDPVDNIATQAISWLASKDFLSSVVAAVNNHDELEQLIRAGSCKFNKEDQSSLEIYKNAISADKYIPFFIAAAYGKDDNRRRRLFSVVNLARALKIPNRDIPLNTGDSDKLLNDFKNFLLEEARNQGFGKYIK
jgi:predicted aldo/keto reductase-like oxidoreductase